jgi:Lon protease-like protein
MTAMPMFPLGSVLFPHMPLSLRIFEERYIVMLSQVLQDEPSEFGVVLIERGQEVGGGEKRFSIGTIATITQLEAAEGFVGVVAVGERRVAISEWLDEDPFPQAVVSELPDLEWDDALLPLWERAEKLVRRTLARASEFSELNWSPDAELSQEPVARAWQLAAIAPLGPLDQVSLLRSVTMAELLDGLIEHTLGVELSLSSPWATDGMDDAGDDPEPL